VITEGSAPAELGDSRDLEGAERQRAIDEHIAWLARRTDRLELTPGRIGAWFAATPRRERMALLAETDPRRLKVARERTPLLSVGISGRRDLHEDR
jgi:transposase